MDSLHIYISQSDPLGLVSPDDLEEEDEASPTPPAYILDEPEEHNNGKQNFTIPKLKKT